LGQAIAIGGGSGGSGQQTYFWDVWSTVSLAPIMQIRVPANCTLVDCWFIIQNAPGLIATTFDILLTRTVIVAGLPVTSTCSIFSSDGSVKTTSPWTIGPTNFMTTEFFTGGLLAADLLQGKVIGDGTAAFSVQLRANPS
jgi:hypothetical protein